MAKRRGRDGRAYRPWLVLAGFVTAIVNVLRGRVSELVEIGRRRNLRVN